MLLHVGEAQHDAVSVAVGGRDRREARLELQPVGPVAMQDDMRESIGYQLIQGGQMRAPPRRAGRSGASFRSQAESTGFALI